MQLRKMQVDLPERYVIEYSLFNVRHLLFFNLVDLCYFLSINNELELKGKKQQVRKDFIQCNMMV